MKKENKVKKDKCIFKLLKIGNYLHLFYELRKKSNSGKHLKKSPSLHTTFLLFQCLKLVHSVKWNTKTVQNNHIDYSPINLFQILNIIIYSIHLALSALKFILNKLINTKHKQNQINECETKLFIGFLLVDNKLQLLLSMLLLPTSLHYWQLLHSTTSNGILQEIWEIAFEYTHPAEIVIG